MKRFFLILLVLFLVIGIGLAVFSYMALKNFDPNQYRPFIERKISESIGAEAQLGRLAVSWQEGLGVRAEALSLKKRAGEVPFFSADDVVIRMNLWSFLQKKLLIFEFEMGSPKVLLVRKIDGSENWSFSLPQQKAQPPAWSEKIVFLFTKASIHHGSVRYRDETQIPVVNVGLSDVDALLRQSVPGGPILFTGAARALEAQHSDLEWQAEVRPLEQKAFFEISFQGGDVLLKGDAYPFQKPLRVEGEGSANGLDLRALSSALSPQARATIAGHLSGQISFQMTGNRGPEIRRSLTATGALKISDGALLDQNFVKTVLERITLIPGLGNVLIQAVPETFQSSLQNPDTPFERLETSFVVQNETLGVQKLELESADFHVTAKGAINFQGGVDLQGQLLLKENLSSFLVGRVHELSFLSTPDQEIVVPFIYRGQWPKVHPQPDVGYVGQKLMTEQGQRIFDLLTNKFLGEPEGEPTK